MAEAPTWTPGTCASSPGTLRASAAAASQDVGVDPLSEPGEHQLILKRPVGSTSTDGTPQPRHVLQS
eukprot:6620797-Prymnesium_polylepis.1